MNRRTRGLAGLLALAVTSTALTAATPATAAPHTTGTTGPAHQVTLITGDRVQARQRADGDWNLSVEPAQGGATLSYRQFPVTRAGRTDWYLVPRQADPLLAEGVLDRELFNITGLIRQGYDDARQDTVPLLVEYPEGGTRRAAELRGARVQRELSSLNVAVVAEPKAEAAEFWRGLTEGGPARLAGGVRRIWLNGKVSVALDTSVGQVGAPVAWQAGFTGKGVTVAVLDTGIDDTHPDVAGKVKHRKDFTGKGNVTDGHGHGTHVAATVAGSGAAGGGKYKGVAPEADLAVGKVLDDSGTVTADSVLRGMEWAAAEVKARIVSMSLGGVPTDGLDPLSQAVNTLTRKHNTLFVIAAGNLSGPGSVISPGAADLALTVGSITKSGGRSDFSSQGPRLGDGAVKPEISAPGSDIVAARGTGTALGEPVNERYTSVSGTSMATPHVAGGAAILAQQHPDWTAEQLKSALVGTADPVGDLSVFAAGTGRMDLGKAVGAKVTATPSAHNAFLKWPATAPVTRTVTYTNPGSAPLPLGLKLDLADTAGAPAPAGLAKLSAGSVTVPAGGQASVTITVTPRTAKAGSYGGTLTATGGGATLRTAVGVHEEGEHHDVTAKVLRPDGVPATVADGVSIEIIRQQDGKPHWLRLDETLRLPPGAYTVLGSLDLRRPGAEPAVVSFSNPEIRISKATTLSFDLRQAKQVRIGTDQPTARAGALVAQERVLPKDGKAHTSTHSVDARFGQLFSYSTPGVSSAAYGYANSARLLEPDIELFTEGARREEMGARWFSDSAQEPVNARLPSVYAGDGSAAALAKVEVKGRFVVISPTAQTGTDELYQRISAIKAAGGLAVGIHTTTSRSRTSHAATDPAVLPSLYLEYQYGPRFVEYAKTGGPVSLHTRQGSRHRYELAFPSPGKFPATLDHQVNTADLAAVSTAYHGYPADSPPRISASMAALGGWIGVGGSDRGVASAERVEHFTPGEWGLEVRGPSYLAGSLTGQAKLAAGKSYRMEWNRAVNGPGFAGTISNDLGQHHPWAWATGEVMDVTVPWFTDAAGHPRGSDQYGYVDKGTTVLYGDGVERGRHSEPGRGVFLRGNASAYRLEAEISRDASWWRTSTKISVAWSFARPQFITGALPLLAVRYAPPVDLRNLAPGDREFTIPVTVPRQDGPAKATSLTVDYSVDDGATWQSAKVAPAPTGWSVTVRNPARGFVSLRAKASEGANAVEQTVLRAYEIG
ncbi:S8 family serine peptidase [Crossiella cryophila]|uniref:Subtilisin family serine protease n=1 Tax=Crossiella cryophila TaxID=43355 RepID=A0A7W7CEY9_9PSEU|nr:S8 family serine peptidase [Crossiella cryophila]MBB4679933.1 subtilisin family serine protease [Crossiella cryophila]